MSSEPSREGGGLARHTPSQLQVHGCDMQGIFAFMHFAPELFKSHVVGEIFVEKEFGWSRCVSALTGPFAVAPSPLAPVLWVGVFVSLLSPPVFSPSIVIVLLCVDLSRIVSLGRPSGGSCVGLGWACGKLGNPVTIARPCGQGWDGGLSQQLPPSGQVEPGEGPSVLQIHRWG